MIARTVAKAPAMAARRGFSSSTVRLGSPYHYPEGPRSNLPFDPLKRSFAIKFWTYCAVGFGAPFAIAVYQTSKNA